MSTGGIAKFLGPEMGLKWAALRDGGLESPKQIAVANLRGHIRVQLRFALPSKSHPTPPANDQVRMIIGLLRTELAAMSVAKKDRLLPPPLYSGDFASVDDGTVIALALFLREWGRDHPQEKLQVDFPPSTMLTPPRPSTSLTLHYIDVKPTRPLRPCHTSDYTDVVRYSDLQLFQYSNGRKLVCEVTSFELGHATTCLATEATTGARFVLSLAFPCEAWVPYLRGASVVVFDPYLNITVNGQPSVRIDCADDIQFVSNRASPVSLASCKKMGDPVVRESPLVAVTHYFFGLKYSGEGFLAATLCNNAAVALSKASRHLEATRYAAAASVIGCASTVLKSRSVYLTARSSLSATEECQLFTEVDVVVPKPLDADATGISPQDCKERGNEKFRAAAYLDAVWWYQAALRHPDLDVAGKTLSNVALAFTELRAWRHVLSAAAAAPLISASVGEKNRVRYFLAGARLGCFPSAPSLKCVGEDFHENFVEAVDTCAGRIHPTMWIRNSLPSGHLVGLMELRRAAGGKGRGMFATADIPAGSWVLMEPTMTTSAADVGATAVFLGEHHTLNTKNWQAHGQLQRWAACSPAHVNMHLSALCTSDPTSMTHVFDIHAAPTNLPIWRGDHYSLHASRRSRCSCCSQSTSSGRARRIRST